MVFSTMTLRDGRTVEYLDLGDAAGRPVLYCHGTPSTAGMAVIADEQARAHHVRLVAPTRPGYGDSSPSAPGLASAATAAIELADLLGLDRFAALGVSGGGPFALAMAAIAPGRISAVTSLAGVAAYTEVMPASDGDAAERAALADYQAGNHDRALAALTRAADSDFGPLRALSEADFTVALPELTAQGGP